MTTKDTAPAHIWEALRRLLNCNRKQLAARLGVNRHTLAGWERMTEAGENPGANAMRRASDLLIASLRAAQEADTLAQWRINWTGIDRIAGRR
ncbi:MAG: hypothetical protein LC676_07930 [Loktanella sp.]|nr:hypothetical protein [Loktanella sp.]